MRKYIFKIGKGGFGRALFERYDAGFQSHAVAVRIRGALPSSTFRKIVLDKLLKRAHNMVSKVGKGTEKMTDSQFEVFMMHGGMTSEGLKSEEAIALILEMGMASEDIAWLMRHIAVSNAAKKIARDRTQ